MSTDGRLARLSDCEIFAIVMGSGAIARGRIRTAPSVSYAYPIQKTEALTSITLLITGVIVQTHYTCIPVIVT